MQVGPGKKLAILGAGPVGSSALSAQRPCHIRLRMPMICACKHAYPVQEYIDPLIWESDSRCQAP